MTLQSLILARFAEIDWRVSAKDEEHRRIQIKRRARNFRDLCRAQNMAFKLPDTLIDSITDSELDYLKECLANFNVVKRADYFWEAK